MEGDGVGGMQVERAKAAGALEPVAPVAAPSATEWTCPMHPEIVRSEPGSCPICGMALEPRTVTLDERNPELEDMTRRFWVSTVLTAPAVILAMGEFLPGHPFDALIPGSAMSWIQLALRASAVRRIVIVIFKECQSVSKYGLRCRPTLVSIA